jgi:competence ComEA-like helix-hairpin-helix protein
MNKIHSMLHTVALSLLLIGSAHAGKAVHANKAAVVAATSTASHARSAHAKPAGKPAMKVNINTADAAAINEALINIGPSKAAAIVAYRKQHGAFRSADQLAEVKGVGLKTVEKNRDRIVVGGVASAAAPTAKR